MLPGQSGGRVLAETCRIKPVAFDVNSSQIKSLMLILDLRNNIAFLFGTLPVGTVTDACGFPVSLSVSSELPGEGPECCRGP